MKRFIFYLTLIVLLIAGPACEDDFLDNPPQGQVTNAIFPQNPNDARLAVNGMYSDLRKWQLYYGGFPLVDMMSDDARKGSSPGDGTRMNLFVEYTFQADIADISNWYSALYEAIKSTNVVIERVAPIAFEENPEDKAIYLAQARFLRALHYFQLVRGFGDVPLVIELNVPDNLPRSPKEDIYNQVIIPDLLYAIDNLPTKNEWGTSDLGRATRGAAQALLAKTYLYTEDFVQAEEYAVQVINSGIYGLEPTYENAFLPIGRFGTESIFEVGALPDGSGATGGNQFANTQSVRGEPNRGWGFSRPTLDLRDSFEDGDIRMDETIIFLGETIDGIEIIGDMGTPDATIIDGDTVEIETYNEKVWVPGTTTEEPFGYNVKEMRYAEVLLIAAEAMAQNGNTAGALTELNKLRTRAELDPIEMLNGEDIMDIVMEERRHEMALEQERFFDLVRTGRAPEVLGPLGFIEGKHETFPIPSSELLLNSALTQSAGW